MKRRDSRHADFPAFCSAKLPVLAKDGLGCADEKARFTSRRFPRICSAKLPPLEKGGLGGVTFAHGRRTLISPTFSHSDPPTVPDETARFTSRRFPRICQRQASPPCKGGVRGGRIRTRRPNTDFPHVFGLEPPQPCADETAQLRHAEFPRIWSRQTSPP